MSKKIFAIGGGKKVKIYCEMFELAGVSNPKLLLLPLLYP